VRLLKSGLLIRRLMLIVALISLMIAALDLLNILPGIAPKLTPVLLAFIILFQLYSSQQQRRSHQILRSVGRKLGKQSPRPTSASKPNKKRQPNPQPEYRSIAWHGLTLRSQSEVKIAKALDNKDVLFLADPKIRLNTESHRQTREVDFLVQYQGKWGILEVDGPHHQHSTEADQWRDARFTEHGLLVVRFLADQCYRQPDLVVETFLKKLAS
jgi:very-short-patch-repair endonuclease